MSRCVPSLVVVLALTSTVGAEESIRSSEQPVPVVDAPGVVLTSSGMGLASRETAGPDTFVLYGGPEHPTEGKFQLENGVTPDWGDGTGLPGGYGSGPDAWTPVDLTDHPVYWHRSQFNAQTLGTDQPVPNHAMWCGVDVGDPIGASWEYLPGYGNNWRDALIYHSEPVADVTVGETVTLDFYFHHDTEPGFDYFNVEYDSAGTWTSVLSVDGSDKDASDIFHSPGVQFSAVSTKPIQYTGNDYGGDNGDQMRIRLMVTSDGAWSDEDGLWRSTAGAAQIDDITLTTSQGTFVEDFETPPDPPGTYLFYPEKSPFAGDFAEVYPSFTDIDPCRDNSTPVIGFIDFGQLIRNGPGPDGTTRVEGGSTSPGINYGIPGNYVVNYNGGISFGEFSVTNEIWSPDIYWDLPGPADDDVEISGAYIRWTGWTHLPLYNGIFYVWHVRSARLGENYDTWTDRNYVYYGGGVPVWDNYRQDVSDILQASPDRVQMAFGVWDYAELFGFVGTTSTPSPCFDNAAFYKYRITGPVFATRTIDLAQDGFPISGSIDVSTQASRDALDVPFSMARDVNTGNQFNVPGDSVIFDVDSVIPGAWVTDMRMVWALSTNPLFEDAIRQAPARARDINVVAGPAGTVWTGEVIADTCWTSPGALVEDRYFVTLPDMDFMYPGDVLHYYFEATDSDGRTSTLPLDTSGFLDFEPYTVYDREFTVRCLPSIEDESGRQIEVLVWNDFGHRGGEEEWITAFHGARYYEGWDYDTYTTKGPSSRVSNGLGSAGAHGATADQLAGYHHIFYFAGDLDALLLSNGSDNGSNDKGDDIGVLEAWHEMPGDRNSAYFGDNIASALVRDSAEGLGYLGSIMGVAYGDEDVRDVIGGQTAPLVVPNAAGPFAGSFATQFIAYGGCLDINQFDQIQPQAGAASGHLFTDAGGVPIPEMGDPSHGGVASVINPRSNGYAITFPYSTMHVYDVVARHFPTPARRFLLEELLGLFQAPIKVCVAHGYCVDAPPVPVPVRLRVTPNPFNPSTTVEFTGVIGMRGSVKIYNLRGELVRTLHSGEFVRQEFRWSGVDERGVAVASGVYLVRAEAAAQQRTAKIALIK